MHFFQPLDKNLKKWADNRYPLEFPNFWYLKLQIGSQLWATPLPNPVYGLRKFSQWRPLEAIRKHVSSTVRWSGLGLSYDDLNEARSSAHQLKYATLIAKRLCGISNWPTVHWWETISLHFMWQIGFLSMFFF